MIDTSEILLTVLMPVFNSEKYLKSTIESIINQTQKEFEFLIINDGSTDSSDEIIKSFKDSRIVYLNNSQNKGIVATLNQGLELSRGKYIARMDADDIAEPDRLKEQLNYMLSHPECKMCGTQAIGINDNGEKTFKIRRPLLNEDIKVNHLFRNCFIHPSVVFEGKIVKELKYDSFYQYAEDYYLFSQIILKYPVANLKERLLLYRVHADNITTKKQEEMNRSEKKTMHYLLSDLFGVDASEKEVNVHWSFLTRVFNGIELFEIEQHLLKIKEANKIKQTYNEDFLLKMLQMEWFNFLFFSKEKNSLMKFVKSDLFSFKRANLRQVVKLFLKRKN